MRSVTDPFSSVDYRELPALRAFHARDGARLHYRVYSSTSAAAAGNTAAAILIHGSAGSGAAMHSLGLALKRAGVTSYVPDIRGHGHNMPRGDVRYVGQLEHDLLDLLQIVRRLDRNRPITLVGHSCGGGLLLRFSMLAEAVDINRYVLLAPAMAIESRYWRRDAQWYQRRRARLAWLRALHLIGFRSERFARQPVVRFPIPPELRTILTETYSRRLMINFAAPSKDHAAIAALGGRLHILIGSADEIFDSERYRHLLSVNPSLSLDIIPNISHSTIVVKSEALDRVVEAITARTPAG
jgi:non-heme chloroperoxidase